MFKALNYYRQHYIEILYCSYLDRYYYKISYNGDVKYISDYDFETPGEALIYGLSKINLLIKEYKYGRLSMRRYKYRICYDRIDEEYYVEYKESCAVGGWNYLKGSVACKTRQDCIDHINQDIEFNSIERIYYEDYP